VKTGVQGIRNDLKALDSGPFDKPFENLRVLSNVEGVRLHPQSGWPQVAPSKGALDHQFAEIAKILPPP
jgi:hypothetical protein